MAKKNTSVNLEEDILEYIDNYRDQYSLSSRNKALERIILKFQTQEDIINNLKYFEDIVKKGGVSITPSPDNKSKDYQGEAVENVELSEKGKKFKGLLDEVE